MVLQQRIAFLEARAALFQSGLRKMARRVRKLKGIIRVSRLRRLALRAEVERLTTADAFSRKELRRGNEIIDGLRAEVEGLRKAIQKAREDLHACEFDLTAAPALRIARSVRADLRVALGGGECGT